MLFGGALIALALIGYGIGFLGEYASRTALIPAAAGVPIFLCGLIGQRGGATRKHAMHVAAVFGVLGALATIGGLMRVVNPETFNIFSAISVVGMLLLCGGFVVVCVLSFREARKARQADAASA